MGCLPSPNLFSSVVPGNVQFPEMNCSNLREINCSVLGDENDAIASECEEPLHTKDILSYEDKYVSNAKGSGSKGMASVSRKIPAELSPEKREEVRELAVRSFKALGCNGVSRIDFMIDEDNGKLYFNEINTIPAGSRRPPSRTADPATRYRPRAICRADA